MRLFSQLLHSSPRQGSVWISKPLLIPGLAGKRPCSLYLPPDYEEGNGRSYPLMYLFDGQNLFDDSPACVAHWRLHRLLDQRWEQGLPVPIVAGIHHGPQRDEELSPWPLEAGRAAHGEVLLGWLAQVLHPILKQYYAIDDGFGKALLGGSFLGGLLAICGCFRHPEVFGKAFSLTPSLWAGQDMIQEYVHTFLREKTYEQVRLYLDTGLPSGAWGWPGMAARDQALSWLDRKSDLDARALTGLLETHGLLEGRHIRIATRAPGLSTSALWERSLKLGLDYLLEREPEAPLEVRFDGKKIVLRELREPLSCW